MSIANPRMIYEGLHSALDESYNANCLYAYIYIYYARMYEDTHKIQLSYISNLQVPHLNYVIV